ncbi:MAG: LCP family protein [Candidatus Dormibacteria bacterium]
MAQRRRRAGLRDGGRRGRTQWGPLPASYAPALPPAPAPGDPAPPRHRRRWPWVVLALLLVALVPAGYYGYKIASTVGTISQSGSDPNAGFNAPQNLGAAPRGTLTMLLMGSDERHDSNGKILTGEVPHSDTMILAAIDTDHKSIRVMSVPRDLLVTIPGYGPGHRINEAYTLGETQHLQGGGPALAVKTMEQLTNIKIPYYAVVTFDGFRQSVEAVGGVTIDVERPITDHDYPGEHDDFMPVYVPAGRQLLDGQVALEYVRSRHDDPLGDFGRNQRQQHFLAALGSKALKPGRISQFTQFLDIIKGNLRTNLSPPEMLGLGNAMISSGKPRIQAYAVGPNQVRDPSPREAALYGAVLVPNQKAIAAVVKAFLSGAAAPLPSASPSGG